ncbi:MBL fold metallo-hydrolase [Coraliomargarita parva]|uniref:MBL fold metallo-hydrolase n=1 Tax=Coraliomargarita parva TaxID=3014050 RepID=UPI0022B43E6D|nr:MBL fold metallo-hydrolase [Coraliomargarita parva]
MLIASQELPPIGTNAFALIAPERKECVIIDAPQEAYSWAQAVAEKHDCKIVALILTHGHWDHMLDGHKFAEAGIPTYGHKADKIMFASPEIMASFSMPGMTMPAVPIDHWIDEGDKLKLLGVEMEIRHVPGHCPGNILVYVPSEGVAFVGDAIFAGSIGRCDLPGGDFAQLSDAIRTRIYSLPQDTKLYPGHGPETDVETESLTNPYVRQA